MRIFWPLIRAAKRDMTVRKLLLTLLLKHAAESGEVVYMPNDLLLTEVPRESFDE